MSGAEIGLALAIIPLCIAAAENYNNVLRPFKHYHNYAIEVQRFEDELANQQVIYVLELQLLLSSVTSWETTEAMVEDPHHPKWKDADIEERLSAWLGKSYESCGKAIRLICEDLASIAKESSFFDTDTEETALPMPPVRSQTSLH